MKEFQIEENYSEECCLKSLEQGFREWNMTKSKIIIFLLTISFIGFIYRSICVIIRSSSLGKGGGVLSMCCAVFLIIFIVVINPKLLAHQEYKKLQRKMKNLSRSDLIYITMIRENYVYSCLNEKDIEEKKIGQILGLKPTKNYLFICIESTESSKRKGCTRGEQKYIFVRKDAFTQGTAKECYDYLKTNYPQIKFNPW